MLTSKVDFQRTLYLNLNLIDGHLSVYISSSNRTIFRVRKSQYLARKYTQTYFQVSSTPIKSCKKYLLTYKDSSNNLHQLGIYARDAYDCLMLARDFNSYVHDHPNAVTRIQQKV